MLENLRHWDRALFERINGTWSNPVFDAILPWARTAQNWYPLYLLLILYFILTLKQRAWLLIVSMVATITLADQISAHLIKNTVRRLRPCMNPDMVGHVHLRLDGCSGGFSFVSSHACNHFAAGVFLFLFFLPIYRSYAYVWLLWAATISYAQVYVGVHYPIDVLCGGMLGSLIGYSMFKLMKYVQGRLWTSAS